jgi:hypothetical protein
MATIHVTHRTGDLYDVVVDEDGDKTTHEVTATAAHIERYAPGVPAEELIANSFSFLLDREPKEAILRKFDLPTIERYFPEYRFSMGG